MMEVLMKWLIRNDDDDGDEGIDQSPLFKTTMMMLMMGLIDWIRNKIGYPVKGLAPLVKKGYDDGLATVRVEYLANRQDSR